MFLQKKILLMLDMTKNILQIKKKIIYILEITVKLKEKEFLIMVRKLHINENNTLKEQVDNNNLLNTKANNDMAFAKSKL